jgi:hypothetical protein
MYKYLLITGAVFFGKLAASITRGGSPASGEGCTVEEEEPRTDFAVSQYRPVFHLGGLVALEFIFCSTGLRSGIISSEDLR